MSETTGRGRMRRARARGITLLVTTLALVGGSAALAPAAFAAPPSATITLEASPAVTQGETVEVTVSAETVVDLYAYDLLFEFDPALLQLDEDSLIGPDGGFSDATVADGILTLTHTRLGTSPGLAGDLQLFTFSFTAIGGGDTTIVLTNATLVSTTAESTTAADVAEASVSITALPDPDPEPTTSPSPSPSSSAAAAGTAGTASSTTSTGQPLAVTGADSTPWLIGGAAGLALLAAGTLLVLRRRRAVSE